ncbi:TPA: BREX-1 system adenine-specific DNA-methyltransferase PglX [Yersinia enterocolitica]|nr:BREX-1 system adenine-specific DNA-methyltransferase PglX [Yersinia enterocolitica]HEN3319658.1 BREX-1 system adenine-specific DNA-methyltransferase PglX [Yersinia enterocolitica]
MSQQNNNNIVKRFYRASSADFNKVSGAPIAYWLSNQFLSLFSSAKKLSDIASPCAGLQTSDNNRFLRLWHEVSYAKLVFNCRNREFSKTSGGKWFPCTKGGSFRRWYGNNDYVVNWENDGEELFEFAGKLYGTPTRIIKNANRYFESGLTWSSIAPVFSMRYSPIGFIFETKGSMCFPHDHEDMMPLLALTNSKVIEKALGVFSPTLDFHEGPLGKVPISFGGEKDTSHKIAKRAVTLASSDWDSYENSWDFNGLVFSRSEFYSSNLKTSFQTIRTHWVTMTLEIQRLEEENNRLFIEAYDLGDELSHKVPLNEITLTCNPRYRYGGNLTDQEREERLQSNTLAEMISYIIGCMMGRYSLDREGLVYAYAGNKGFKTLVEGGAYSSFPADSDGILPLTSEVWFKDDIAARVIEFVRTVWGGEHLEENLQFIADSLCLAAIQPVKKGGETSRETIRRYLSTQFFKDHLKTYKKRPIYWLFSSGKEKAFECLVYLHRYNETTLPRMRTEYVTPLLGQIDSRIERLRLQQNEAETAEAKRIGKEIDNLTKQLTELRSFDDQLKHYADMKIQLDLDDGVKANYGKFGTLLSEVKAITGDKTE